MEVDSGLGSIRAGILALLLPVFVPRTGIDFLLAWQKFEGGFQEQLHVPV